MINGHYDDLPQFVLLKVNPLCLNLMELEVPESESTDSGPGQIDDYTELMAHMAELDLGRGGGWARLYVPGDSAAPSFAVLDSSFLSHTIYPLPRLPSS